MKREVQVTILKAVFSLNESHLHYSDLEFYDLRFLLSDCGNMARILISRTIKNFIPCISLFSWECAIPNWNQSHDFKS